MSVRALRTPSPHSLRISLSFLSFPFGPFRPLYFPSPSLPCPAPLPSLATLRSPSLSFPSRIGVSFAHFGYTQSCLNRCEPGRRSPSHFALCFLSVPPPFFLPPASLPVPSCPFPSHSPLLPSPAFASPLPPVPFPSLPWLPFASLPFPSRSRGELRRRASERRLRRS